MTPMKFVGTVLVISFSAFYAAVRRSEMKAKIQYEQLEKQKETNQLGVDTISKESDDDNEDLSKPEKREVV